MAILGVAGQCGPNAEGTGGAQHGGEHLTDGRAARLPAVLVLVHDDADLAGVTGAGEAPPLSHARQSSEASALHVMRYAGHQVLDCLCAACDAIGLGEVARSSPLSGGWATPNAVPEKLHASGQCGPKHSQRSRHKPRQITSTGQHTGPDQRAITQIH